MTTPRPDPGPKPTEPAPHVFSVDLEEHFQVSAFEGIVAREEWPSHPSRVEASTDRLLDLLARHDARATFFALGWLGERKPELLRRIDAAGHEIASHTYWHRRLTELSPEDFREDLRRSKRVLEDAVGRPVLGFRAPTFSLVPGGEWAFDVLIEEGFTYDSSLFPIRRPGYGYPDADPEPHVLERPAGHLFELPMTTLSVRGVRIPASGGGWFRQLPYGLTRAAFTRNGRNGASAMFYIHPWELDPDQPRLPVAGLRRIRHYRGLELVEARLERLLSEFRFTSVRDRYGPEIGAVA
jgi:polysaccharide deacetylase family protein (PEP-CTERM system associated)